MIGWTKSRKRCSKHGLVLRGRPGSYSDKADYCPACGEQLTIVSVPYLFQVYFHPAIAIVPGIIIFAFGLFMFLDVRGCVIADREANAVAEELRDRVAETMPSEWKILYSGMAAATYDSEKWIMLSDYLKDKSKGEKMPFLGSDQVRAFLDMIAAGSKDDAFALITKCMEKEK